MTTIQLSENYTMKTVLNTSWNSNIKGLFLIVCPEDGQLIMDGFESIQDAMEWKVANEIKLADEV